MAILRLWLPLRDGLIAAVFSKHLKLRTVPRVSQSGCHPRLPGVPVAHPVGP